jgi:NAD(P)H dehydrogenase (quinone)
MHAPPKPNYPILAPNDLAQFDGFIIGVPTRYGSVPAQWRVSIYIRGFLYEDMADTSLLLQAFWDATGSLWQGGKLHGKYAGVFVSTGGHGGGQEATVIGCLSTFAHHGISYVPLGYSRAFPQLTNLSEVHSGEYDVIGVMTAFSNSYVPARLSLGCWHFCCCRWFAPAHPSRARDRRDPRQFLLHSCCQGIPVDAAVVSTCSRICIEITPS